MITDISLAKKLLPRHLEDIHKGMRGRVLIVGGSVGLTGAACMASLAALKSGAGLVTVAVPKSLNDVFEVKLTEVMTLPLSDDGGIMSVVAGNEALEFAKKCDAVAIGPGMGRNKSTRAIVELFLREYKNKLILDADALNVLSEDITILNNLTCDVLITPHVFEMSRLTDISPEEIMANRCLIAEKFSNKYGVNVLLKGKNTVITNGKQTYINPTGNNGMAKGGSGDVLTGVCASFAAQGVGVLESGVLGAFIHGMAGDIAREKYTEYSVTPSDVIDNLSNAFKNIL